MHCVNRWRPLHHVYVCPFLCVDKRVPDASADLLTSSLSTTNKEAKKLKSHQSTANPWSIARPLDQKHPGHTGAGTTFPFHAQHIAAARNACIGVHTKVEQLRPGLLALLNSEGCAAFQWDSPWLRRSCCMRPPPPKRARWSC